MKIFNTKIRVESFKTEEQLTETLVSLYPRKDLKEIKKAIKETKLFKDVQKATPKSKARESKPIADDRDVNDIQ